MASIYCRAAVLLVHLASGLPGCTLRDVELFPDSEVAQGGTGPSSSSGAPNATAGERCEAVVPAGMLAARPPMGWNGWTTFECAVDLDEGKVRKMADALVDSGMQTAGYTYVNLDRCWGDQRNEAGDLVLDSARLPNGITALASELHERGFKLGFHRYSSACSNLSSGREAADAKTYAAWGIDFLKLVSCTSSSAPDTHGATAMAAALRDSGRSMVLSLAMPPHQEWMPDIAHMSRTGPPIAGNWTSILSQLDATAPLAAYVRPGAFNDPDLLVAGVGGLSEAEQRAHFSLWSILSAPLLASNDLTAMPEATRRILTHPDLIAINQDPLGLQGALIRREGDLEVYAKPVAECGARAVVLLNRGDSELSTTLTWEELWLSPGSARVRDLWAQEDLPSDGRTVQLAVEAHDVRVLKITGVEPPVAGAGGEIRLGDASFTYETNGYGPVERNATVGEQPEGDGQRMRMRGRAFADGLGVHPPSLLLFRLAGRCTRFTAQVGIDDESLGQGSAVFQVWSDGEKLFDSGIVTGETPPRQVDVLLHDRMDLRLFVGTTGDGFAHDHSDWAEARLYCDEQSTTR
ncbi:MAG: alpha-galactosidase [Polyangiaceae bacterium]|nr:alpha-galactosidase [Polyangiaceae bacterium]